MLSRVLLLAGAAATVVAVLVPWVTVRGLAVPLDLGVVGAQAGARDLTVSGIETAVWPAPVVFGLVVAALALAGAARRVLLVLGLLVTLSGGALLAYVANVLDIETRGDGEVVRAAAGELLSSSIGPGPPLLLAGGLAIAGGALLRR